MHVSTGSSLCLRSHLGGEFREATSRSRFGLSIPARTPNVQQTGIASEMGGGEKQIFFREHVCKWLLSPLTVLGLSSSMKGAGKTHKDKRGGSLLTLTSQSQDVQGSQVFFSC